MYVFHIICMYIILTVWYSSFVVVGWGPWSGCDRPCGGCGISRRQQLCNDTIDETQRWVPSKVEYKTHRIPKPKYFSARLAVVFAQSIEDRCEIENEDVVGDASTRLEWSQYSIILIARHTHQSRFEHVVKSEMYIWLTHWGRDKMAAVSQTTLSNAFSWMKMSEFRLRFHWSLFLRVQLTIFQHWFR